MRKLTKVLSALLAMTMLFSMVSIGVEAQYSPYKDDAIRNYDSIDQPVLTTDQYGSMIMDYLDHFLAEKDMKVDLDLVGVLSIKLDLRSVDSALDDVVALWHQVQDAKTLVGGDIVNLDFSAIENAPRRDTLGSTDLDIIYSLLQFLADNSAIIGKVADGSLDLGIVNDFVSINDYLDIPKILKGLLARVIYGHSADFPEDFDPDTPGNQSYEDISVDDFVVKIVFHFLDKLGLTSKIPATVLAAIDFENTSIYDILDLVIGYAFNSVLVPLANNRLKIMIRELCGVDYSAIPKAERTARNGDTSHLNDAAKFIDINYEIPPFNFQIGEDETIIDHLNDFFGHVATNIDNEDEGFVIAWNFDDGNDGLLSNIAGVVKQVLKATGHVFFSEYIPVPTDEEYDAMTNEQLICFLLMAVMNGKVDGLYIEEGMYDTIPELLFNFVKNYVAEFNAGHDYGEFDDYDDPVYAVLDMAIDLLVYVLNQYTNVDLPMNAGFDEVLTDLSSWAVETYGGAFDLQADGSDPWELLDEILFTIIPSNWLPERDTDGDGIGDEPRDSLYDILFTDLFENAMNLDLAAILKLIGKNKNDTGDNESELAHSLTYVVIQRVSSIINFILPGVFSDEYENFEDLLTGDNGGKLKNVIVGLLNGLNDNAPRIMAAGLPIACMVLKLSTDQEFEYPYISLAETINTTTKSFYISNESSGLNTAATYANGDFEQDDLYKYQIKNVKTNQSGVTVTPTTATINGGDRLTLTINGNPTANAVLTVTITYDVLDERGNPMTTSPLIDNVFTFVSDLEDDGETDVKVDVSTANTHYVNYKKTTYINQNKNISELSDFSVRLSKGYADHMIGSTVTNRTVNINPALSAIGLQANAASGYNAIAFGGKGGAATDKPFTVDSSLLITTEEVVDEETGETKTQTKYNRPNDGVYANTLAYTFSPSSSGGQAENINFTQFVYFYNDYNLPSLLASAVKANRQQNNYGTDTITVEKELWDEGLEEYYTEEVELNGAECWNAYVTAMQHAASAVYKPRQSGTFAQTVNNFETYATELKDAIENLSYFELEAGIAPVANALYAVEPLGEKILVSDNDTPDDPSDDIYRGAYYYEDGYSYVGRIDYVGYTYERFSDLSDDARGMIAGAEKGAEYSALEVAYLANKLNLYADRLIRVKGEPGRLQEAYDNAEATMQAGNTGYTAESWDAFVTAYNFAASVLDEAIENPGVCYPGSNYLNGDGVRQSKINTAREELNEARKRLIPASDVDAADLTALNAELAIAQPIYAAGNDDGTYTDLSWVSFEDAYLAAMNALEAEYTADDQATVDTICQNLIAARTNLELAEEAPEIIFNDIDTGYMLRFSTGLWSEVTGEEVNYIYGAQPDDLFAIPDMIEGLIFDEEATDEGYEIVWASIDNAFENYGTGSTIEIRYNGDVIESYPLVLLGDINGDTAYDSIDAIAVLNVSNDIAFEWTGTGFCGDSPQMFACDVFFDGYVDATDAGIMLNVANGVYSADIGFDVSEREFE